MERLEGPAGASLVVVSAPAGYGKTTLLAEWAAANGAAVAWLDADAVHADPLVFAEEVAAALADAASTTGIPVPPIPPRAPALYTQGLPRLGRWVRALPPPFVLVIDEAEHLTHPLCWEILDEVASALPPGARLAVGSRQEPGMRIAAARAQRRLAEVGMRDLAMDRAEADLLLTGMGVRLTGEELTRVMDRTEGWPAGLVLAGLVIAEDDERAGAVARLTGGDHRIADFFVEEVLRTAPDDEATLMRRTSVLELLTPTACSVVMDAPVTAHDLAELARRNRFVVRLDARGARFRYHHLFAEMLSAELERSEPDLRTELHRRAAAWHETQGEHLAVVDHLLAADEGEAAAGFVWRSVPALQPSGRVETLKAMISRFPVEETRENAPLALAQAWVCVNGRSDMVGHWTRLAERTGFDGALPGGPATLDAAIALLRATIGADGAEAMTRDAQSAYDSDSPDSPWRSLCGFLIGMGAHLRGENARAEDALQEGADRAGDMFPSVRMLCQSWLAVVRIVEGRWSDAETLASRARLQATAAELDDYSSTGLLDSVQALLTTREGNEARSRRYIRHARLMLAQSSDILPSVAIMSRLLLAHAAAGAAESDTARMLLGEVRRLRPRVTDSALLDDQYARCRAVVEGLSPSALRDARSLTTAEMRVLRHLPTHLTFREIGDRLRLSRFTIKAQAAAVYRKLGANSRSEAVRRARALGLLDP